MHFRNIKDEDFIIINNELSKTDYNGCDYSKTYLKSWSFFRYDTMQVAQCDNIVFLRFETPVHILDEEFFNGKTPKYVYLAPLTTKDNFKKGFELILEQVKEDGDYLLIDGVTQDHLDAVKELGLEPIYNRDYSEYLYDPTDLINFSGKKYHGKRNHIAKFDKLYSYEFRPLQKGDCEGLAALISNWESKKDEEYIEDDKQEEEGAIRTQIEASMSEENIHAYCLLVDNKIIGFSLVEITPSGVAIEHIEKANVAYDGVYSKLLNLVAKECFKDVRIVNRQEDMGDEGLRKSKLSYHPIGLLESYFIKNF